jgi:hypothetical protein
MSDELTDATEQQDVIDCDACKVSLPPEIDLPDGSSLSLQSCPVCGNLLPEDDPADGREGQTSRGGSDQTKLTREGDVEYDTETKQ